MPVLKSRVVGTCYRPYGAQTALNGLRHRDPVGLVREPFNAHDPNAVAVYAGAVQIGYLPREDAAWAAERMDLGARASAWVDGHTPRLHLAIFLPTRPEEEGAADQ